MFLLFFFSLFNDMINVSCFIDKDLNGWLFEPWQIYLDNLTAYKLICLRKNIITVAEKRWLKWNLGHDKNCSAIKKKTKIDFVKWMKLKKIIFVFIALRSNYVSAYSNINKTITSLGFMNRCMNIMLRMCGNQFGVWYKITMYHIIDIFATFAIVFGAYPFVYLRHTRNMNESQKF